MAQRSLLAVSSRCFELSNVVVCLGEKRKLPEALTLEDAKRIRVMGDIPMELVNEVMMTITDPAAMLGPEVSRAKVLFYLILFLHISTVVLTVYIFMLLD